MINGLVEEFALDLREPLNALKFINDVLFKKIDSAEWNFFRGKTRKQGEELYTMILLNKYIIRYLFKLRRKYYNKVYIEE